MAVSQLLKLTSGITKVFLTDPLRPAACNCGTRLCEPVTGDCICPPRTLRPECTQCEPQTFGCHPVVGCEVCNCSRPGVTSPDASCDTLSGQCRYEQTVCSVSRNFKTERLLSFSA